MQKSTSSPSKNMPEGLEPLLKGTRPLILGVTGGIASGKSTVVKLLEKKGSPVIDFDVIAREIVELHGHSVRSELLAWRLSDASLTTRSTCTPKCVLFDSYRLHTL